MRFQGFMGLPIVAQPAGGYNRAMSIYGKHVFVCVNQRPADDPRGCCNDRGGRKVRDLLKEKAKAAGLLPKTRINASGCLGLCQMGATMVVYPEGVWYGKVSPKDVDEILEEHLVGGKPVERLHLKIGPGS
jgi:(2Fe-2S) ferredoxin